MEYYAHSANLYGDMSESHDLQWQTLEDHLNGVADRAEQFAEPFGLGKLARAIALLHDAGKATSAFQRRLQGSQDRVDHSTAGAKYAVDHYGSRHGQLMAYAIAGHHAGMPNGTASSETKDSLPHRTPLAARLKLEIEPIDGYQQLVDSGQVELPEPAEFGRLISPRELTVQDNKVARANQTFALYVAERMLFSCLVDADYLDTESFMTPEASQIRERDAQEPLDVLLNRLENHMSSLMCGAVESPVNDARRRIYESCCDGAALPPGLFTLTVPTGGGKTLSSLAFALRHAVMHGMKRVIFAIPFTSITSQTAAVFKSILGEQNVLEHHSNYDFADLDDEERARQRLAVQNWDAPVVVTTNVQLLESLFSNKPGKSRKVHNIAQSVIVIDEAQALPDGLLKPSLAMLEELVLGCHCSIVLCTATQPALEELWPFKSRPRELVEDRRGFDCAFNNRVEFDVLGDVDEADLVNRIASAEQVLCIVATKGGARMIYDDVVRLLYEKGEIPSLETASEEGVFHLSANMVPAHRDENLNEIRRRLITGERCVVISTQLVEAGVDVDFPEVYRELAGLDSVMQAAGRCNREGRRETAGTVHIFECFVDGERQTTGKWLENMKSIARNQIRRNENRIDDELVHRFFNERYLTQDLDAKGVHARLCSKSIVRDAFSTMPFEQVSLDYQIIDEESIPVFVPWGQEGRELLGELLASDAPAAMARKLQRFSVSVPVWQYQRLNSVGAIEQVEPFSVLKEDGCLSYYSSSVGLLKEGEEELEFLIG